MPNFIMLCGVPTAGKSTFCKTQNISSLSSDRHIENYAKLQNLSYNEVFDDFIEEALGLVDEEMQDYIKNNESFILDQTNLNVKNRLKKLRKVPAHYNKIAVYFEISKEEMLKRNHNEDRRKVVPQRVLLMMFDTYKRPSIDEGFDEVYDGRFLNCPDFSLS